MSDEMKELTEKIQEMEDEFDASRVQSIVKWTSQMFDLTLREKNVRDFRPPKRGEIWTVNLGENVGAESNLLRPCLIIQDDHSNRVAKTTVILPITSHQPRYFSHIAVRNGDTNEDDCTISGCIMTEQIRVVSKARLSKRLGVLKENKLNEVEAKLNEALGFKAIQSV